ncbi:MAG: hypothetical protein V4582_05280 [Pseudomonadota bacterium]
MKTRSAPFWQYALFALFSLSGFSGLIYESVWANYLKFFLGHAAYAQTLVLALFMGGMAGGSWLTSRYSAHILNPLLGYAMVELLIGVFGLFFHKIFLATSGFLFDSVLPGLDSPLSIELIRWGFAAMLILPQTILLGSTFPLISAGILRAFPDTPGSSISLLYFTNSIGAVVGVLVSGFVLIGAVGLPGTILSAALMNFLLALFVYLIAKKTGLNADAPSSGAGADVPYLRPLLVVAMVTGLSSFIYEISWIRMLAMIIGSSTHAFELMLSAFILGLALGGLYLRTRVDRYRAPLLALGVIQFLMGLLALFTVVAYNPSMELMYGVFDALQANEVGYVLFNVSSHLLAIALMLPVTFMAGMTLPLITFILFRSGAGESAIGKVYASNTAGAIIGVALAAMVLLPQLGLKLAVMVGASLDLALAVYLLYIARARRGWQVTTAIVILGGLIVVQLTPRFDPISMASGPFRMRPRSPRMLIHPLMHIDGKTASVDVYSNSANNSLTISTNGKADASIVMAASVPLLSDESTMTMLGALPLALKPDTETAAVIGMGAGMSANVLLMSPRLKHLDIIEIEGAMVEGARLFGPFSAGVFSDPRSHIHIDDAKSYFAAHQKRYDMIVSEPSDSWVSGVSNLFTDEFYQRIRHHLSKDGVLVQWLHTYETSPALVSSIFQAIGNNFEDYGVYAANDSNIIIVAKAKGQVGAPGPAVLQNQKIASLLERIHVRSLDDLNKYYIGNRQLLEPLFVTTGAPINSDFFPYVDQHAVKARYLRTGVGLASLQNSPVPMPGNNYDGALNVSQTSLSEFRPHRNAQIGRVLGEYIGAGAHGQLPQLPGDWPGVAAALKHKPDCTDPLAHELWSERLASLAIVTIPNMSGAQVNPILSFLRGQVCDAPPAQPSREILTLMSALAARDMPATERAAITILDSRPARSRLIHDYAFDALLLSYFQQGKWTQLRQVASTFKGEPSMYVLLMMAHARWHTQKGLGR